MFALLTGLLAATAAVGAAPASLYDQRQDGEMNVRADVQNVVLIVAIPQNYLGLFKSGKTRAAGAPEVHERAADVRAVEAFVEPSTPYRVEIAAEDVTPAPAPAPAPAAGDGRSREVVIAARRAPGPRAGPEPAIAWDSLKLLGATEQCGPGRARDDEGICRPHPDEPDVAEPPVLPLAPPAPPASPADSTEDLAVESQPVSVVKI